MCLDKGNAFYDKAAWYCLRAQPKREKVAACHLRTLEGVTPFLPMVRYEKHGKQGPMECIEPIFPGYLFACFVPTQSAKAVRYTQGVGAILKRGDNFIPVDEAIIHELESITDDGLLELPVRALQIGEKVKIVSGIFVDFNAEIIRIVPAKQRVRILIELLGRTNEVEMHETMIERQFENPLRNG